MTYARVTDGTTTVDLIYHSVANTNYLMVRNGWAPSVPPLSLSDLGGHGPYDPVEETIEVYVFGSSEAAALANLDALNTLIEQAERFWRLGQSVSPVTFHFAPTGSTIGPLQCLLLGRPEGENAAGLALTETFNNEIKGYQIRVTLRLLRQGQLLAPSETATSASASIGDLMTTTLPSTAAHMSPMDALITGFGPWDLSYIMPDVYFLFAPSAALIVIQEAEALTATGYTSVADGNGCRGAAVLRYTPGSTALVASGSGSSFTMAANTLAFFAMVRNNSATTSFDVNVAVTSGSGVRRTTPFTIDTSSNIPRAIPLGLVSNDGLANTFYLEIAASAASGTLDIDAIYILGLNDESSAVVKVEPFQINAGGGGIFIFTDMSIRIASEVLTATQPSVKWCEGTAAPTRGALAYDYDPFLMSKGNTVCCVVLAPGGPGGTARWRYSSVAPAVETTALQVTRYPAYLTPR